MKTKNNNGDTRYVCQCCILTFESLEDYQTHLINMIKLLTIALNETLVESKE